MEGPNILVVLADDSSIVMIKMMQLLRDGGYHTIPANHGAAAVEATRKHLPDLVILDVEMPKMGGIEACKLIKGDPKTRNTPVLMFTACADALTLRDCYAAGCDGYLLKSASDVEILRKIELKLL